MTDKAASNTYLITSNCTDKQSKQQADDHKNDGMYSKITNKHTSTAH